MYGVCESFPHELCPQKIPQGARRYRKGFGNPDGAADMENICQEVFDATLESCCEDDIEDCDPSDVPVVSDFLSCRSGLPVIRDGGGCRVENDED